MENDTCEENFYAQYFPYGLFFLLDHFNVIYDPYLSGFFLIMVMLICTIQVCAWCGLCRCFRTWFPANCVQWVSSAYQNICRVMSMFFIEVLVFGYGRLFSKKEFTIDEGDNMRSDVTYLLFLRKPVAFLDRLNPLLKPARNTRIDSCCCFSLIAVFSFLLLLIGGMVVSVFARTFPVTVSYECGIRDESNNRLYCYDRNSSWRSYSINCANVSNTTIVECYAFTFEFGKASSEALGQLTFSVLVIYIVILLFRLWVNFWQKIFGTNGKLVLCANYICSIVLGVICGIALSFVTDFLLDEFTYKLMNDLKTVLGIYTDTTHHSICSLFDMIMKRGGFGLFLGYLITFSHLYHDVAYFGGLFGFFIVHTLALPFSIPCLVSYYENKPVFNKEDVIGNHPQGDRDDNGDPQEVNHDDNGDVQEVDRNNDGDPQEVNHDDHSDAQEVDRNNDGDPQEVNHDDKGDAQEVDRNNDGDPQEVNHDDHSDAQEVDRNNDGDPQEVNHDDNGDAQEVDRGDNGNSQEVDHDDSALQEIDHDDGKPQENGHDDPDGEITPDHLPTTEPSDSPQLRQHRP